MTKKIDKQLCKHCYKPHNEHDDWVATGEFYEYAVCITDNVDENGRYRELSWFEPMSNLEYLEWRDKKQNG